MTAVPIKIRKAAQVFPLSLTTHAAAHLVEDESAEIIPCKVVGFATETTQEAGAESMRVKPVKEGALPIGCHCGAVRVKKRGNGFLPALFNGNYLDSIATVERK